MNPMNFVAVILKVLLVDLLAALNFAEPKNVPGGTDVLRK